MKKTEIPDNLLSAFLEGNVSAEETRRIFAAAQTDAELRKVIELSLEMDYEDSVEDIFALPMQAKAAKERSNRCVGLCEVFILSKNGIERSLEDWEKQAFRQGWIKDGGTPIYNIGRMLEQECFSTARTFHNNLDALKDALKDGDVIVVVDHKELTTNPEIIRKERKADTYMGETPNHAVVVTKVNDEEISFYDPETSLIHTLPSAQFNDAWEDSSRFMLKVTKRDFSKYEPHPIDLSDVELPEDLEDLREAIAENAHEVWAKGRKSQGWTYGVQRNDSLKQTPDMVPYSDLSEEEKFFDREMAMNTIKLLRKLGYKIIKEK